MSLNDRRALIEKAKAATKLHRFKHYGGSTCDSDGKGSAMPSDLAWVRSEKLDELEALVASLAEALEHPGIPTEPGTIADELTDPATHGKTLVRNSDGTYRTVGRA